MTPETLAALHAKAFSATRAWSAEEFADLLKTPGTFTQGDDACFALVRIVVDEAEVLTLATAPNRRRQGLARAVLQTSETAARTKGAKTVFLEVAEDNTAARALYSASGYTEVGRRPGYYLPKDGAPIAALVLRKALTLA